jgi:acetylornithine/succinyldiaminopimelate/putrescine aminotransferase/predicted amino acid dehydrogenase/acyl-coenzyme A synthetase/AMP-(fatty) acid ligase
MIACVSSAAPTFAEVISSPLDFRDGHGPDSLAELIFGASLGEDDAKPIILGTAGHRQFTISLRSFRHAVVKLSHRLRALGLSAGDCVCLARLPRTSETLAAALYGALAASGMRVLFPMYLDTASFGEWLAITKAKAVFWAARELRDGDRCEADLTLLGTLDAAARQRNVPAYCFEDDLGLTALLEETPGRYGLSSPEVEALRGSSSDRDLTLILTTSGTSGRAKLVGYRQRAILNCCKSWSAAGFYSPETLGGRCLCLLLAHSMGLRAFWNAVWTRQALCLVPPEWFFEHPDRVRALLTEMTPLHVTGGPAAFHTMLELGRVFPQLKDTCFSHLRCGVSSGAPFDAALCRRVSDSLGLRLENGFGMTETMQVLSTLAPGPLGCSAGLMGNPLPGVRIGLEPASAASGGVFKLWVQVPFGFDGYLPQEDLAGTGASGEPTWFYTGDLVERTHEGLQYLGREQADFTKDGFGVKVPYALINQRYRDVSPLVSHMEMFPLAEEPGLVALIFTGGKSGDCPHEEPAAQNPPWLTSHRLCQRIRSAIEARHERLLGTLDDFELRHLTIARFACIAGTPPLTAKGNVSRQQVESKYREALRALTGRMAAADGVVEIKRDRLLHPAAVRLASPHRGALLELARLDKNYVRAEGDYLYYEHRGESIQVLDLVGGFGLNLLGHRHPALTAAAQEFAAGSLPWIGDQGSLRRHEGELAALLVRAVSGFTGQSYIVRFGSTGAEAVEMALAHAFLERRVRWNRWRRSQQRQFGHRAPRQLARTLAAAEEKLAATPPCVLVFERSFHGNSLGARSLRGGRKARIFSPMTGLVRLELPLDGDPDIEAILSDNEFAVPALADQQGRLVETEARFSSIIAAIYEPILGEGGICEPPAAIVRQLQDREFPLIADEIQCGLGRAGSFLASAGIHANYYLFAKALGGGIAKISATLIERSRYVDSFDERYATTFGGDAFSCAIARRVLALIKEEDAPALAASRGAVLKARLSRLAAAHPQVIRGITGRGLMLGIHLDPAIGERMFSLRLAERHELLGVAAASYLLNRHRLRLLPTLSACNTLRVEPSIYISDGDMERLESGLDAFCNAVERKDSAELLGCLVEDEFSLPGGARGEPDLPRFSCVLETPAPGARRVAFLCHFVMPEREIAMLDPALATLSRAARSTLLHRMSALTGMKPTPLMARNLFNGRVWFSFLLIGAGPAAIEETNRSGKRHELIWRLQQGVELAAQQGCEVVSLGAYTSVVTRDGTALHPPPGVHLTTGNSLTVAVGARRILRACQDRGIVAENRPALAVVGATGNIGSALTRHLLRGAHPFSRVILVARDRRRLRALADLLAAQYPEISIENSTDLTAVRDAGVIAIAVATNEPLLYPHHLRRGHPTVVADISAPAAVSPAARELEDLHVIPLAGTVVLPGERDFVMASHIHTGTAFCCAAEAMLLGLAAPSLAESLDLVGPVDPEAVDVLARLADEYGFLSQPDACHLLAGTPQ